MLKAMKMPRQKLKEFLLDTFHSSFSCYNSPLQRPFSFWGNEIPSLH